MLRFAAVLVLLLPLAIAPAALGDNAHDSQSRGKSAKEKSPNSPSVTPDTPATPAPPQRGQPTGDYDLSVTGHYTGTGTATVTATVSLSATVQVGGAGATGIFTATDLVITKGYFTGKGTIMGIECTINGRIDLPSADDTEQTPAQAITGRITGTFKDANGNVGRIVAVQKVTTPPPDPTGPNDKNDPNGNPNTVDGQSGHRHHGKDHDGDKK